MSQICICHLEIFQNRRHIFGRREAKRFHIFQGIIPSSANDKVTELFVEGDKKEAALAEASSLPSVDISTLDMEWLQVISEGWASPMKG